MTVLDRDDALLVVHKPSGVLAQPDHTGDADVLSLGKQHLTQKDKSAAFLGLVHRLDRPTSGLMVLARTSTAARHLSRQFRERTVQKQYLALVDGERRGIGSWRDYIAKPGRRPRIVEPGHPDGKLAELDWQALARADGRTLLLLRLHTGRPHQIRLQAAERGSPVVGDERYEGPPTDPSGAIALHHAVLRIEHPTAPRRETFVAAPPSHWSPLLADRMQAAVDRVLTQAQPS